MWMAPEKREVNRKKGRDNRKKGRFGITPKQPETRASTGFPGRPRARARKNKKKQVKNPGAPGTGHPCGVPPRLRRGSPSPESAPQRGASWAPSPLPPAPRPRARGASRPLSSGVQGGRPSAYFLPPCLERIGFRRRQGRYAPPTAVSPLTPTPPLGVPKKTPLRAFWGPCRGVLRQEGQSRGWCGPQPARARTRPLDGPGGPIACARGGRTRATPARTAPRASRRRGRRSGGSASRVFRTWAG